MHFVGAALFDAGGNSAPRPTAVAGTQIVGLYTDDGLLDLDPLAYDYDAVTDDGNALSIDGSSNHEVTVRGDAAGDDYLRIVEAGTDLLFDRIEIEAQPVAQVLVRPRSGETNVDQLPLAFLVGELQLGVSVLGADGTRLVDQSLDVQVTGGLVERTAWDSLDVAVAQPGTVGLALSAGGLDAQASVFVVDAVDQLLPSGDDFDDTIAIGDSGEVCFEARAGAYLVAGLEWTFAIAGPATEGLSLTPNCVALTIDAVGEVTITASAGGETTQAVLGVSTAARRLPARDAIEVRGSAGERAAAR